MILFSRSGMSPVLQLTLPVMISSSHVCKLSNMFCPVMAPAAKTHTPKQLSLQLIITHMIKQQI